MSKELAAMVQVEHALNELSEDERQRVLAWAGSRFGIPGLTERASSPSGSAKSDGGRDENSSSGMPSESNSLAEFYDAVSPSSDGEKVLVAGYWLQYKEGIQELESQRINSELKHLGHGVGNVTRALDWNKEQKPALIIQKRKDGTTKQARKKFSVTNEGKKYVERMARRA
ncbi:hypothetical protein [Elioraea sp.]|uniref:hypothetical protein n=1 Tax=Elioraea sp. TaxID=2185103 RepID=UPI003F6E4C90